MPAYHIERLTPAMLPDLAQLYATTWGRAVAVAYLQKKYATSYLGLEYLAFVAYRTGGPMVAAFANLPTLLHHQGRSLLTVQGADAMTHPTERGQGWFARLGEQACALAATHNAQGFWAITNAHTYHATRHKMGMTLAHTMSRFTIPVRALPLERFCQLAPALRAWYQRHIERCLQPHLNPVDRTQLFNSALTAGWAGVQRDAAHFAYRCFTPNHILRLATQRVWVKVAGGLLVGDMDVGTPIQFRATLAALHQIAQRLGVRRIIFQVSPQTPLHQQLQTYAPAQPSWPVVCRAFHPDFPADSLRLSWGDGDTF